MNEWQKGKAQALVALLIVALPLLGYGIGLLVGSEYTLKTVKRSESGEVVAMQLTAKGQKPVTVLPAEEYMVVFATVTTNGVAYETQQ